MKSQEKETLEALLIVGAKIKLGRRYCKGTPLKPGTIFELVEGHFEHDNGLYTEDQTAPSVWDDTQNDFDSIYHLFGNELDGFMDCEVL